MFPSWSPTIAAFEPGGIIFREAAGGHVFLAAVFSSSYKLSWEGCSFWGYVMGTYGGLDLSHRLSGLERVALAQSEGDVTGR